MFPPLNPWNGMHVQVIHFPIALLLVAPLFVVLALAIPRLRACFSLTALVMMALGSAAAFLAVATGEAAAEWAMASPQTATIPGLREAIERHGDLAEWARTIFAVLALVYAALLYLPGMLKRPLAKRKALILQVVFLIVYGLGMLFLANAAHRGGLLVHQYGLHANLSVSEPVARTQ